MTSGVASVDDSSLLAASELDTSGVTSGATSLASTCSSRSSLIACKIIKIEKNSNQNQK